MKVELLNPITVKNIYHEHGEFACTCYGTPDKYADKVGKACAENGHFSGSRHIYIKFKITDIDRGTAEQCLRHEIGTDAPFGYLDNYNIYDYSQKNINVPADEIVKNMASFRYIDKDGFNYATPSAISSYEEINKEYCDLMNSINDTRKKLIDLMLERGFSLKSANENANFVLPRATTTEFCIAFTPEALINFCNKRMCNRAQEFIHKLAFLMRDEIEKINPDFAADLRPHCENLLYCPEGKSSCGYMPTKEEVKQLLRKEF